jgi:hypothetical protein
MRQEDVADPCSQIVDGGDDAFLRGTGVVKLLNEAPVDKNGGQDTDVVPWMEATVSMVYAETDA